METPERLLRLGLKLEYTTLAWNVVGAVVAIAAAVRAHSVALIGFGLDSLIEIGASTVVVWQLRDTTEIERERRALRLIGTAFFAVALYVLVQSCRTLLLRLRPNSSLIGIAWLAVTFVAMLALAFGKSRTGAKLNNPVLKTEARVTLVDAYLVVS